MNNNIKEILNRLKEKDGTIKVNLSLDGIRQVEDYITNLQEENQKLNKEKNVLLENLCMARQKYNNDKARYRRKAKTYKEELDKIKSRNEKAIQREMELSYLCDTEPDEELLNILQGSDKE